ncbi:MAG TPA: tRNA (adenosine(37)-N6)-threonylcarbamoyltransferase complex ATPase subunit type 1 TsaE [Papillibacter sp.]|nr:tRNA (adenosine(37)-N6)-threonylcarbamoyltransferase complex ATPase subunit type 1 TsaE [Papillibacter sp.]HHT16165.1 tRNA (adenosine(37)-N6)-threonylcarbamoyltransferase complex ATPase subunit type 1 TsaE [Papillibacter sp.]
MTIFSHSEKQTEEAGRRLAGRLSPGAVVALYGGLGAGKTAFVRGLSEGLGIGARVSSPTFTIVNEYPGNVPLFHFDMYRLSGEDELYDIGWDEYLERGGIIAVEWSEIVPNALPEDAVRVVISHTEDGGRRIDIELPEAQK